MTLVLSIITLFSVLLAVGLMVRHSRDMKEIKNLQEQVCYAQHEQNKMGQNYLDEQQKTARLLNRIVRQTNELHHNREEISTLKSSNSVLEYQVNTLLLKNKLHSCKPQTILQDD